MVVDITDLSLAVSGFGRISFPISQGPINIDSYKFEIQIKVLISTI